jgi:DNA helicase-2/ATP-dependent DNA helicase PcrA
MNPSFSPAQKEAIEHGEGPLLIIAGAGTGKTLVITHRIAHLIATKRAMPHEILALTFTEKAAAEMEERVDLLTPYGYTDVQILTFHAFGDRLLRELGMRIGLPPDFRVLSEPEQVVFFRKYLFDFPLASYRPLGNPTKHIESILTLISRAKDEDISPESYLAYADHALSHAALHPEDPSLMQEAQLQKELAETYQIYQRLCLTNHCIDHGDQVFLPLCLLRTVPALLQRLPYRYILVDEFQDTNLAQFKLIQLMAQQGAQITVVGDDDQSIYKFRGASIANIQKFTTVYPDAKKVVLTQNFRSRQEILDAAYRLIQYNNPNRLEVIENVDKRLHAAGAAGEKDNGLEPIYHTHFDTTDTEADWISTTISEALASGQGYGDFAILVRKNAAADPFIRALNFRGIPNRFTGNRGLFNRPEVRLMSAFIRAVVDRHDSTSLYYLLSSDLYPFPIIPLSQWMTSAKRQNRSLFTVLESDASKEHTDTPAPMEHPETLSPFQKLKEDLDGALNRSREVDAGVVLYEFIHKSGLLSKYSGGNSAADDTIIQNIARFFEEVRRLCSLTQTSSLHDVVASLDLLLEAGEDPPIAEADLLDDAVRVLTVHRAKGLEFDTVFMVGLHEGGFPTRDRGGPLSLPTALLSKENQAGNPHIEEERRLFYVGITRAKNKLILTSAKQASGNSNGGGKRLRKVSPFVMEALNLPREAICAIKSSPIEAISREAAPTSVGLPPTSNVTTPALLGRPTGGDTGKMPVLPLPVTTPALPDRPTGGLHPQSAFRLSYYQIDDYLTCPLKYKYIHILGVPIYPHHTIVYGSAMHNAIAAYLMARQTEQPFTAEEMIRVFESGWKSEGYLSRVHEEQRMAAGRKALFRFYEGEEKSSTPATYVEKEFSFAFEGIKIKGRWDRVNGGHHNTMIIDYKTSDVSDQEAADKRAKESMQLTLYAWAYREQTSYLPEKVVLHFLDSGVIGTAVKTEKDIEKLQEKIRQVSAGIRTSDFAARPTYMACRYCAYQNICPYTASAGQR